LDRRRSKRTSFCSTDNCRAGGEGLCLSLRLKQVNNAS
jgi:hypothetical protein